MRAFPAAIAVLACFLLAPCGGDGGGDGGGGAGSSECSASDPQPVREVPWRAVEACAAEERERRGEGGAGGSLYRALAACASTSGEEGVEPFVVRDSPAAGSAALDVWGLSAIREHWPLLTSVYTSTGREFVYSNDFSAARRLEDMPGASFAAVASDGAAPFAYYNAALERLPPALRGAWDAEAINPLGEAHDDYAWIGEEGVRTSAHYDADLNLYAQLHGRKYFWLAPPAALHSLALHPSTSTTRRQARRGGGGGGGGDAAEPVEGARSVVLSPGDLLVLPPFWFHLAEAQSFSMSVNHWFALQPEDDPLAAWDEAMGTPLPFEEGWDTCARLAAASAFLRQLLKRGAALEDEAQPPLSLAAFAGRLHASRYGGAAPEREERQLSCPADAVGPGGPADASRERAEQVAAVFRGLRERHGAGLAVLFVENYVESLAAWVAEGDAELAASVVRAFGR